MAVLCPLLVAAPLRGDEAPPPADSARVDSSAAETTRAVPPGILVPPGSHDVLPASPRPFGPGERLEFSVQYGPINAGSASLEVGELRDFEGHTVYTLMARARSNRFIDRIYKVRNYIESYMDRDGRFSWRYFEDRREGGDTHRLEVVFDQQHREAHYADGTVVPIPAQAQDALSSFYYTRYLPLPIGGSVLFDYHASRKSAPLEVKVLGRERVETPAGKFDCVVVEPMLKAGGVFKNKGRLWIWLTADERRLPVQMKSKVTIGSVSVILTGMRAGA